MVLPDVVKSHPVISAALLLTVIAALGLLAVNFSQGSFVDDSGCGWMAFNNPNGGNFTSISQVKNYFEQNGEEIPERVELQEKDGVVYQKIPGSCTTVGGGN